MKKLKVTERALFRSPAFMTRLYAMERFMPKNKKLLEIGCGYGYFSKELHKKGNDVTGIDYDKDAVKQANHLGVGIFTHCDIADYETTEKYDVVVMTEVLEHIKDEAQALRKAYGFLKDGGELIISVPIMPHTQYYRNRGHYRHYTKKSIRNILDTCGFEIVEEKSWGSLLVYLIHFLTPNDATKKQIKQYKRIERLVLPLIKLDVYLGIFKYGIIARCRKK